MIPHLTSRLERVTIQKKTHSTTCEVRAIVTIVGRNHIST